MRKPLLVVLGVLLSGCPFDVEDDVTAREPQSRAISPTPDAVFTPGNTVTAETIRILAALLRDGNPTRHSLWLTLAELRADGSIVFLGEQTVLLADTEVVAEAPAEAVVRVTWEGLPPLQIFSEIEACAQLVHHRASGSSPLGDTVCRTFEH